MNSKNQLINNQFDKHLILRLFEMHLLYTNLIVLPQVPVICAGYKKHNKLSCL